MDTRAVYYDRRSLKIHGESSLLISGSIHYPRVDPLRWKKLFLKMKTNHLNCVETYVFWNEHEIYDHETGKISYDFSGSKDLLGFIRAAHEVGLYVILRIGVYVCAEVNYGGFPARLRDVSGIRFRTWNEPFMREVEAWLDVLSEILRSASVFASQGGPVILVQLENEYSMVSDQYGDDGVKYLEWIESLRNRINCGIPYFMCYGATANLLETINAFYAHQEIPRHRASRPNEPLVWTEAWSGWYDTWCSPHHKRDPTDLAYAVARFFAGGGSAVNYYMYHGGSNFSRSCTMYLQATSYDYDAPLDEFGYDTVKSKHLSRLHEILKKYQTLLCLDREDFEPEESNPFPGLCIFKFSSGKKQGESLIFICNDSTGSMQVDGKDVCAGLVDRIAISAKSVAIYLDHGITSNQSRFLFDSSRIDASDHVNKRLIPGPDLSSAIWQSGREPVPVIQTTQCKTETELFADQISLTHDESDYCWYSTSVSFQADQFRRDDYMILECDAADFIHIFFEHLYMGSSSLPLFEDRRNNRWTKHEQEPGFHQRVRSTVKLSELLGNLYPDVSAPTSVSFQVHVLCVSLGMIKGDWQLGEKANMLDERKGLFPSPIPVLRFGSDGKLVQELKHWQPAPKLEGERLKLAASSSPSDVLSAMAKHSKIHHSMQPKSTPWPTWYYAKVSLYQSLSSSDNLVLDLKSMSKGYSWVNGICCGRYWNAAGTNGPVGFLQGSPIQQVDVNEPTQRFYRVPPQALQSKSEYLEILIFDELGVSPQGISIHAIEYL